MVDHHDAAGRLRFAGQRRQQGFGRGDLRRVRGGRWPRRASSGSPRTGRPGRPARAGAGRGSTGVRQTVAGGPVRRRRRAGLRGSRGHRRRGCPARSSRPRASPALRGTPARSPIRSAGRYCRGRPCRRCGRAPADEGRRRGRQHVHVVAVAPAAPPVDVTRRPLAQELAQARTRQRPDMRVGEMGETEHRCRGEEARRLAFAAMALPVKRRRDQAGSGGAVAPPRRSELESRAVPPRLASGSRGASHDRLGPRTRSAGRRPRRRDMRRTAIDRSTVVFPGRSAPLAATGGPASA